MFLIEDVGVVEIKAINTRGYEFKLQRQTLAGQRPNDWYVEVRPNAISSFVSIRSMKDNYVHFSTLEEMRTFIESWLDKYDKYQPNTV
jgi:hypothetical protein